MAICRQEWNSEHRDRILQHLYRLRCFTPNSKRVPKDQEDADDCEFAAADHMFEQLDAAVKRPSAIQYSGPNIRITIICSLYASASRGQIQKILRDDGAAVAYHAQTN